MRYCGIDVSAKPGNQQLVTLHERRSGDALELVATFYEAGTVDHVAATIQGFGGEAVVGIDAPSGHRLDLLRAGSPVREALELPEGRYERMRVCDALLFRRGLPLYPVPAAGQVTTAWEQWIEVGFEMFAALESLGIFRPEPAEGYAAPVGDGAVRFGRLCETYPDAVFCSLLGHRPSPKRTPWGLQQRIAALKLKGIVDADGGLWHRTLDELDACAAAYSAYALAAGEGNWVGDPTEGVIVLPGVELKDRYERLPPPNRHPLVRFEGEDGAPARRPSAASRDAPMLADDEPEEEALVEEPPGVAGPTPEPALADEPEPAAKAEPPARPAPPPPGAPAWPRGERSVLAGPDGRGLPAFGIGPEEAQRAVPADDEESNRRGRGRRGALWRR